MKNTHQIKVETITPIHIGNGNVLHPDFDFLVQSDKIVIIDEEKIFSLIGKDAIPSWVSSIENKTGLMAYLKGRKVSVEPDSTGKRSFKCLKSIPSGNNTIREQIHNGTGRPYLPGSSLKGALRTALFGDKMVGPETDSAFFKDLHNYQKKNSRFSSEKMTQKIFGDDPNHDSLRLLRVGDINFKETVCIKSQTLNTDARGERVTIKREVDQFIECIPENAVSIGTLQVPEHLIQQILQRGYLSKDNIHNLNFIAEAVRTNTEAIIRYEELQGYYDEMETISDAPEIFYDIQEKLHNLLDDINNLKPNQFIVRLGFGSGFNFMTGGWINTVFKDIDDAITLLRRDVRTARYDNVRLFPKSRKILETGSLLGFLKVTF